MNVKEQLGSITSNTGLRRSGRLRLKRKDEMISGGTEMALQYYKSVEIKTITTEENLSTFKIIQHPRFKTDDWKSGSDMIEQIKKLELQFRNTHPGIHPLVCFDIDDTLLVATKSQFVMFPVPKHCSIILLILLMIPENVIGV
jgi:hypothetical protein